MLGRLRSYEGSRLAVAGLCVAAILFIAVNVLANTVLKGAQIDLTEGDLYTVSEGTRRLLGSLEEPVTIRLYYSRRLGEVAPRYGAYYARVHELLDRYVALSGGKLSVELLEPRAVLRCRGPGGGGRATRPAAQSGGRDRLLRAAGSNTIDGHTVIPFFNLEREPFLEYDLTKLIHGLANPDRPVLGVLGAAKSGRLRRPPGAPPPLLIFDQIREFFTVEDMEPGVTEIPEKVKTLLVVNLKDVGAETLQAIDRFVHSGGRALVFADTVVESAGTGEPGPQSGTSEQMNKLLRAWGVQVQEGKVAGDIDAARRVSTGESRGGVVADYIAWLTLGPDNFDADDPVMANVQRLNLASSGILQPIEQSGLQVTPDLDRFAVDGGRR